MPIFETIIGRLAALMPRAMLNMCTKAPEGAQNKPSEAIEAPRGGGAALRIEHPQDRRVLGEGRSNIFVRGPGTLVGVNGDTGNYRRPVIPDHAECFTPARDCFNLSPLAGRSQVNVVIMGDSLTTYGANSLSVSDTLACHLETKLLHSLPHTKMRFFSRGIGGTRWADGDGVPNLPAHILDRYPWYTDKERAWLAYVEDLEPDLVWLSWGMNESDDFDWTSLERIVSKLRAMPSAPIIGFVTNMVPNLSPHTVFARYGKYAAQEARDRCANWVRSYAAYHGHPCIDIHDTFCRARDGMQLQNTYLLKQPEVTFDQPSIFMAGSDQACHDFSVRMKIADGAFENAAPLAISISPYENGVVLVDSDGGILRCRWYRGNVSAPPVSVDTGISTPQGKCHLEASLRGNVFRLRIVPAQVGHEAGAAPFTFPVIRHGGLFRPKVWYYNVHNRGPVLAATLSMGIPRPCKPTITDIELWGIPTSGIGDCEENGGNGINHLEPRGAAAIYGAHFAAQDYMARG